MRRKYRHARRRKYRRVGSENSRNLRSYRSRSQSVMGWLRERSDGRGMTVLPRVTSTGTDIQA